MSARWFTSKAETGKQKPERKNVGCYWNSVRWPLSGGAHRVHELLCALCQFSPFAVANQHWIEHAADRADRDCTGAEPFCDIGCVDTARRHDRNLWQRSSQRSQIFRPVANSGKNFNNVRA